MTVERPACYVQSFQTLRLSCFFANAKYHVPILGERRTAGVERHGETLGAVHGLGVLEILPEYLKFCGVLEILSL